MSLGCELPKTAKQEMHDYVSTTPMRPGIAGTFRLWSNLVHHMTSFICRKCQALTVSCTWGRWSGALLRMSVSSSHC